MAAWALSCIFSVGNNNPLTKKRANKKSRRNLHYWRQGECRRWDDPSWALIRWNIVLTRMKIRKITSQWAENFCPGCRMDKCIGSSFPYFQCIRLDINSTSYFYGIGTWLLQKEDILVVRSKNNQCKKNIYALFGWVFEIFYCFLQ